MNLFVNPVCRFTRWVAEHGLLTSPFTLLDAGVQGGVASRWEAFRPNLVIYGFDPLSETIEPLKARGRQNEHYFAMALGNEDGSRQLRVPEITEASTLCPREDTGLAIPEGLTANTQFRVVPIRRLDSLADERIISAADFIKLDCEGFEPEILDGAQRDRKSTRLNSSHIQKSRMPSSA